MSSFVDLNAAFSRFSISPARGIVKVNDEYKGVVTGTSVHGLHVGINAKMSETMSRFSRKTAIGLVYKRLLSNSLHSGSPELDVQRVVRDDLQIKNGDAVDVKVIEIRHGKPGFPGKPGFELVNRAPCPNYLLGLCTFAHPWLPRFCCRDGSHELRPGLQPAGYDKWLVNRGLPEDSEHRHRGWVYGGQLAIPTEALQKEADAEALAKQIDQPPYFGKEELKTRMNDLKREANELRAKALAYRRVGVDAIEELRKQYGKVMGKGHESPFKKLFFAYPDEKLAPNGKGAELWCYKNSETDVQGAVLGVRHLVEVLLGENYRLGASDAAAQYLFGDEAGWQTLYFHAKSLNRNSDAGADVPLQWSAHAQLNHYDHTEVTERTLVEIVAKLGVILDLLFTGRVPNGVKVNPRAVAPALQIAFNAPSINAPPGATTRRNAKHDNPSTVFRLIVFRAVKGSQFQDPVSLQAVKNKLVTLAQMKRGK